MLDLNARPVVFPNLASIPRLMAVIGGPRDVPDDYNRAYNASMNRLRAESSSTTSDPIQIAGMLQQWFFKGLQVLQVKLNPEVTWVSEREFKHFLIEVLQDRSPSHEHKIAFLTWVIHTCCIEITYQVQP